MAAQSTRKSLSILAASITGCVVVTSVGLGAVQEPDNILVTTSGNISSTTSVNPSCTLKLRLYNSVELTFVDLAVGASARNCRSDIPGLVLTDYGAYIGVSGFPPGFRGPADLLTCYVQYHHSECTGTLEDVAVRYVAYGGPDGELPEPPEICPARLTCNVYECEPQGARIADRCGDADDDGKLRALDALALLRASVGLQECAPVRCDADRDGLNTTTDARRVLLASVGIDASLNCPAPCEPWSPE